jgi:predicted nucleic acid-binding protein
MPDVVVVDASLAVQWAVQEPFTAEALALRAGWRQRVEQVLAPPLFLSEVNSPLLKLRRAGLLTIQGAAAAFTAVLTGVTIIPDDLPLTRRAFAIADGLNLRSAHDSLYVALAEREGAELWTADERFYNLAHTAFPIIRWVGELAAPSTT